LEREGNVLIFSFIPKITFIKGEMILLIQRTCVLLIMILSFKIGCNDEWSWIPRNET